MGRITQNSVMSYLVPVGESRANHPPAKFKMRQEKCERYYTRRQTVQNHTGVWEISLRLQA